jgi:transketolase N-terminal domain/subunit
MEKNNLISRILDIAYRNKLSHLGSYFSSVGIIDEIYSLMHKEDIFILSCGHCSVALYAVLEKHYGYNADALFAECGGHPQRHEDKKIFCSTGSLGMGLTVAVGRALANPHRAVHCLISDGECAEGSVWEALKTIEEKNIKNIKVYVNVNGFAAYDSIDTKYLVDRLKIFHPSIKIVYTKVGIFPFLRGLNAHYHVMNKDEYDLAQLIVKNGLSLT